MAKDDNTSVFSVTNIYFNFYISLACVEYITQMKTVK